MDEGFHQGSGKTYIEPIKWCRYIVYVGYITAALMILAHVVWYFAARSVLSILPDIYLRNYIILPAICFFALTLFVDLLVRSPHLSLLVKEYLVFSLFIIFSFYLCITHDIAKVLLGSFILPIFTSTIFSNRTLTHWIYCTSNLSVLLLGVKTYFTGKLDSSMLMQIFVACCMFLCSYLLAKVLIRYGHDNLAVLMQLDGKQQSMQVQLKLDPFTGLYNRKTFDDGLQKVFQECGNANTYLSLAMIDVDHFKRVNDLYGHAVGDRVLLYLSQLLKNVQTETKQVFRIGGEEFAILFHDCDLEEAIKICEDLRKCMESASLNEMNHANVTLSCGLVCVNPKLTSLEEFSKAADSALYAAKGNGRNQVVISHHSIRCTKNTGFDSVC
jgi:diguanylate cyclase (GGDEF)-like protein